MTKTTGSILLVDDEAKIREALAQALREEGHEVVATGCPREAQGSSRADRSTSCSSTT